MSCIFCRIVSGDIKAKMLHSTDRAIAFMDAFPLAPGHTLVIPKAHKKRIQDMTPQEVEEVFVMVHRMVARVDKVYGATLVAVHNGEGAGQEVPHVHVHLVPRREGDGAGPIHSMFDSKDRPETTDVDGMQEMLRG